MINVDVTLVIQMVNFLLLLYVLNVILYRPIRRMVAQRNEHVASQKERIDQADAAAKEAVREFEEKIQAARVAGRNKVQQMKEEAYGQEKELLSRVSREAAAELQAVRERVAKEVGEVRAQLEKQIQDFSRELAQRILGRSLN